MLKIKFFVYAVFFSAVLTLLCIYSVYSQDNAGIFHNAASVFKPYQNTDDPVKQKILTRYAGLLRADYNEIVKHYPLYRFIESWMGTRYQWGGCDRNGIDCSCFVMKLFQNVYSVNINRTTFTQFYDNDIALFKNRNYFELGDLVFFKTNINRETKNNRITHVGFYLANGYFVQSSSRGVNIASLNSGYWKNCFVAAGRLQENYYKKARIAMPWGEVEEKKSWEAEDLEDTDFDPAPYPEELEELKTFYAGMMETSPDEIVIPEMFDYIDKNRYAPFTLAEKCSSSLSVNNCFIQNFYKEVLGINVPGGLSAIASQKFTARLRPQDRIQDSLCAFDILLLKSTSKSKGVDVAAVYLYNGYFATVVNNEVVISRLNDDVRHKGQITGYRIDDTLLKRGFDFIRDKRKERNLLKSPVIIQAADGFSADDTVAVSSVTKSKREKRLERKAIRKNRKKKTAGPEEVVVPENVTFTLPEKKPFRKI